MSDSGEVHSTFSQGSSPCEDYQMGDQPDSPGYIPESDQEEEPEADDDEDPEEDPANYHTDRDDDDEEEEPSGDDADDEDEEEDDEEEEEHPAPANSVLPVHQVKRLLALTTPPPLPLTLLSSPLPQIPSPLLPTSLPAFVLPALPLPTSSPPLQLLSSDRRGRQTQIYQRVETLVDDSQHHYETTRLLDQEALVSREAWGRSMEVSYMARLEIMALRSIVMSQQTVISQLQAADRRSQTVTSKMLQAEHMRQAEIAALRTFDRTRQEQLVQNLTLMQSLQGQVIALQGQQGPSGGPAQPAMIDQGVTAALAACDANRAGDDNHTSGTGVRRTERVARECTYQDFMKCALMWWNSHVRIVGHDAAYVMTWTELKKKMADKYCSRNEMKKLEAELWNLEVQGTDVTRYNQRFQELALLCVRMFPEESDKVERYVGGLPDMIHGSVVALKPKTMQEAT
ncbi:reverse transcriptase domain-containing protein [Tanacetum coccineum]